MEADQNVSEEPFNRTGNLPKDVNLFETLESFEINFETYEKLHKKRTKPAFVAKNEWILGSYRG
jgi:hypothetical protein